MRDFMFQIGLAFYPIHLEWVSSDLLTPEQHSICQTLTRLQGMLYYGQQIALSYLSMRGFTKFQYPMQTGRLAVDKSTKM